MLSGERSTAVSIKGDLNKEIHITLCRPISHITLQSIMYTKLKQQRFGHCYENELIEAIQTIPHNLYVNYKLASLYSGLRFILVYPKH